jgi:hypothetical protein
MLPIFCKDKNVNIVSEQEEILQRWKQYFCDLHCINARPKELTLENIILKNVEEVPPPTYHK